jgi:hypothetical protein
VRGVGRTTPAWPVIHDFCLPPIKVFSVVFAEATSFPVKAGTCPFGCGGRIVASVVASEQRVADHMVCMMVEQAHYLDMLESCV